MYLLDVFTQKFALSDPNPKATNSPSGSVTPDLGPVKVTIVAPTTDEKTSTNTNNSGKSSTTTTSSGPTDSSAHIAGPPTVVAFGGALTELPGTTHDTTDKDATSGTIFFAD